MNGCRDDWNSYGEFNPAPVLTPYGSEEVRNDFYWPQNWPGGRAPCEWSDGGVQLWIEYASEPGVRYLDWISARSVTEAIKADRELTERRDEELAKSARLRVYNGMKEVNHE